MKKGQICVKAVYECLLCKGCGACLRGNGLAQAGGTLRSIPHYARISFVGYPPRIHPRFQRPWFSA